MKICGHCGAENGNDRIFCSFCGEPLDRELKLVMEMNKRQNDSLSESRRSGAGGEKRYAREDFAGRGYENDNYTFSNRRSTGKSKKKSKAPLVLTLIVLIGAACFLFLR